MRSTLIAGAALLLFVLSGGLATPSTRADSPGTSHTIDLDPAAAGLQNTRVVPVGSQFSIEIVLDVFEGIGVHGYTIELHYDDTRLAAPAAATPANWIEAPVLDTTGGNTAPLTPGSSTCAPAPGSGALTGENNFANAFVTQWCFSGHMISGYTGPLVQYVLRCDAPGPAGVALDVYDTYASDFNFDPRQDHVHNAVVTCGPALPDGDGDAMPNDYEAAHDCLDGGVGDAAADGDLDGIQNSDELANSSDPCDTNSDDDSCSDAMELGGGAPGNGGDRDPANRWDFYDVNGSAKVDAADIGFVRANYNPSGPVPPEDEIYDRTVGVAPWAPGPPDDKINAVDIGLVRASFNHSCVAAP
jgi:hypothetical protein